MMVARGSCELGGPHMDWGWWKLSRRKDWKRASRRRLAAWPMGAGFVYCQRYWRLSAGVERWMAGLRGGGAIRLSGLVIWARVVVAVRKRRGGELEGGAHVLVVLDLVRAHVPESGHGAPVFVVVRE